MSWIAEAFWGLLEHGADIFPALVERRRLPAPGTQLIARRALRLAGRDLRSDGMAEGFTLILPARCIVRVDRFGQADDELWVQPLDAIVVEQLSRPERRRATLYGYLLEVPPGIWKKAFSVRAPATSTVHVA